MSRGHDSRVREDLLRGEEISVWSRKAYIGAEREAAFSKDSAFWGGLRTAAKGGPLRQIDAQINRIIAMVRAKAGDPLCIIRRRFGHVETGDRGLAKNRARVFPCVCTRYPVAGPTKVAGRGPVCPKSDIPSKEQSWTREIGHRHF